jgi:hypothetical protein
MQPSGPDQPMPTARDVHPTRMISPLINRMGVPVNRRHTPLRRWHAALLANWPAPTVIRFHVSFLQIRKAGLSGNIRRGVTSHGPLGNGVCGIQRVGR